MGGQLFGTFGSYLSMAIRPLIPAGVAFRQLTEKLTLVPEANEARARPRRAPA